MAGISVSLSNGQLGGVEDGVQGNPGEAAATSHVYAHVIQCPAQLAAGACDDSGSDDHNATLTASQPWRTAWAWLLAAP
jgi:hypothetical protein